MDSLREAGISLGGVNWIMNRLKSLSYLVDKGKRRSRNQKETCEVISRVAGTAFWGDQIGVRFVFQPGDRGLAYPR